MTSRFTSSCAAVVLFALAVANQCLCEETPSGTKPAIWIAQPVNSSVWKRQSLIVRLEADGIEASTCNPFVSLLGRIYSGSSAQGWPQTLVIAGVSDGVHELHAGCQGLPHIADNVKFQYALLGQWNSFGIPEIRITSPWDGAVLSRSQLVIAKVQTSNVDGGGCHMEVLLDGEQKMSGAASNSSLVLHRLEAGVHTLQAVLDCPQYCSKPSIQSCSSAHVMELSTFISSFSLLQGNIPQPMPPTPAKLRVQAPALSELTIGILVSDGPATLHRSLQSYVDAGLFAAGVSCLCFVQSLDQELVHISEIFGCTVLGFTRAIGKGNAWLHIAERAKTPFVVLVEEDFTILSSARNAQRQLLGAIDLLASRAAHGVRLRSRKHPGEPLWAERTWQAGGEIQSTHLLHAHHFVPALHARAPKEIWICREIPRFVCANSHNADYTNNPMAYLTSFVKDVLADHLKGDSFNTMERRMLATFPTLNITIAAGDGVFTHDRVDRSDDPKEPGSVAPVQQLKNDAVRVCFVHHALVVGGVERQMRLIMNGVQSALGSANITFHALLFSMRGEWASSFEKLGATISVFPIFDLHGDPLPEASHMKNELIVALRSNCDVSHSWYGGGTYGTHHTFASQVSAAAGVPSIVNLAWDVQLTDGEVDVLIVESYSSLNRHRSLIRAVEQAPLPLAASLPAVVPIWPGIDASRFTSVSPSFVPPECDRSKGCLVFGRVSRLVAAKAPAVFVQAAVRILEVRPNSFFMLVGDGPQLQQLQTMAKAEGIQDRIAFRGHREDVAAELAAMDVFLYPTTGESVGWVILEAMASGLPVVSNYVGSVPTLVRHARNGLLCDSLDPAEISAAALSIAEDEQLRLAMSQNAREDVLKRFGASQFGRGYRAVYEDLGGSRNVRPGTSNGPTDTPWWR